MTSLNLVALSGTVHKHWGTRTNAEKGTKTSAFQLLFLGAGTYKKYVQVTAFGDKPVAAFEELSEGDNVLVQGVLNEARWQVRNQDGTPKLDENGKELWDGRVEINARIVEKIETLVAVGAGASESSDDLPPGWN